MSLIRNPIQDFGSCINCFPLWLIAPELLVWAIGMRRWLLFWWATQLAGFGEAPLPPARSEASTTNRAPITITRQADATVAFAPQAPAMPALVEAALRAHAGTNSAAAWHAWLSPKDVVGFKVTSAPGPVAGTRPALVRALLESLIASGHPARQIVIWDRRKADLADSGFTRLAEELGVRCIGLDTAGWDATKAYESPVPGKLVYGDLEFGQTEPPTGTGGRLGRKSHVSRLLTQEITRIITVAPLLNHNHLGVHGHIANLGLGTVDNTLRFEDSSDRLAEALPEICALDEIYPKLAICFTDALICQYRGEERSQLHYAVALNELWISTDPVALDVLALRELASARERSPVDGEKPFKTDLYRNCELLELGVADEKRFDVRRNP